jgi:phenylalanyl-tRNA synthetase beta chain
MPTIGVDRSDLVNLIGVSPEDAELEDLLTLAKAEVKGYNPATGELNLDLADTNRPDLWCAEGIARQIRMAHVGSSDYASIFLRAPVGDITVSSNLHEIRPYIAGFVAEGPPIDEQGLIQLIQTQEKLSEGLGKRRKEIAIGTYDAGSIVFPLTYQAHSPTSVQFVPLGFDRSMTLEQILCEHPKGIDYRYILEGLSLYPLITDSTNRVLSFPPIINSSDLGEIQPGDSKLFVEATGTDLDNLLMVITILACNLYDRGFTISPCRVNYPYETPRGSEIVTPMDFSEPLCLRPDEAEVVLGEQVDIDRMRDVLERMGHRVETGGDGLRVVPPPWRRDCMHSYDLIEDLAIGLGYHSFALQPPVEFTIGGVTPIQEFCDRTRLFTLGCGFQELILNVLTSRRELFDLMGLEPQPAIEIENPMTETYSIVRTWIIPSLIQAESVSSNVLYPHRIFEVGEVAVVDPDHPSGSRTEDHLACLIAHPTATFSEIHSCLDRVLQQLDIGYQLKATEHPSFIPGRVGKIIADGTACGLIGEIHPAVLERWHIRMPTAVSELSLTALLELQK